jgi:hypothetical protein
VTNVGELWEPLRQIVTNLGLLLYYLALLALQWALLLAWLAWWLWGVNWSKVWPVLARGGWLVLVLLLVTAALAWSQMAPSTCNCVGFTVIPNFWWQLGAVGLLAAATLFCGWLQGVFGWQPAEISLEPPEPAAGHDGQHH